MRKRLTAALTIPARILVLCGAAHLSCLTAPSTVFAQASEPVCVADADEALARAEEFHELAAQSLMQSRNIQWSGVRLDDFDRRARLYVNRRPGGSLIFYAWDKTAFCAFLWSRGGTPEISRRYVRIENGAERLTSLAAEIRASITEDIRSANRAPTRQAVSAEEPETETPARSLDTVLRDVSALLYPPAFRDALARTTGLSIIPVGPVSTIPLAVLEPLADGRSTVDMFSVNILTLAEDIDSALYGWVPGFGNALVLGKPQAEVPGWNFPSLPGAEAEAVAANAIFGGTLYLSKDATAARLSAKAQEADLLVIAAHGVSDADDPMDGSFLALSDGPLTPRAIMDLKLASHPLVVLSACQSGLGRVLDAGITGIARGFQLAGASNTVMSLWNVDDDATQYQMRHFYENLRNMTPSEALRQATLTAREKFPDPLKWAAFQIFGVSMVLAP